MEKTCLLKVDTPNRNEISLETLSKNIFNEHALGRGSFGIVLKGLYKNKTVAVKMIKLLNTEKFASLLNEANGLRLDHPNVVKYCTVDACKATGFVIMENLESYCLDFVLNEKFEIPFFHRICITSDIVNGLSHCHEHHVIHNDIKPKNILIALTGNGNCANVLNNGRNYICKICDFGSSEISTNFRKTRVLTGTVRYMSPELLRNDTIISSSSDIFALGITMWQLKFRQLPYHRIASNETILYKVVKENIRPDQMDNISSRKTQIHEVMKSKNVETPKKCVLNQVLFNNQERCSPLRKCFSVEKFRRRITSVFKGAETNQVKKTHEPDSIQKMFNENRYLHNRHIAFYETQYETLYKACWQQSPNNRMSIKEVQNYIRQKFSKFYAEQN